MDDNEESQCEKCLACSYCCTGGVTYREDLKKDLCDSCYECEREEDE